MADKTYQWLKLWHQARNDPKLDALTDRQFRVWFRLQLFASEQQGEGQERGAIVGYDEWLLAVEVANGDVDLLRATIERLITFRMLQPICDGFRFIPGRVADFSPGTSSDVSQERQEWNALRADLTPVILERDGALCRYCGSVDDLTIDHVTPLARGGSNDLANLVVACRSCNSSKGARALEEWLS